MVYALYKPLAENDKETVNSIMLLFKKMYLLIGGIILILGLIIYPFLDVLIKEETEIKYLNYYYLIFLLNTVISYLWSYKRSLLIADQKQYIVNNYQSVVQIAVSVLQVIGLIFGFGYFSYIILVCAGTIIENILHKYATPMVADVDSEETVHTRSTSNFTNAGLARKAIQQLESRGPSYPYVEYFHSSIFEYEFSDDAGLDNGEVYYIPPYAIYPSDVV